MRTPNAHPAPSGRTAPRLPQSWSSTDSTSSHRRGRRRLPYAAPAGGGAFADDRRVVASDASAECVIDERARSGLRRTPRASRWRARLFARLVRKMGNTRFTRAYRHVPSRRARAGARSPMSVAGDEGG